jgi:nicotinamidase-related amidase
MPPRFARGARHWERLGFEPPYARVGTRDIQVLDEIAPLRHEPVITKTGASGFTASALESVLFNHGIRELAICGVATAYCVESTLRDAADHGYDTVLVEDGCADSTEEIHQRGVAGCAAFGRIDATERLVAEIGSPAGQ